jgi:mannitol-1-phosphate 5-dehydrogenase
MKAVVFGPGRIGCGFAGALLNASGYEVVFAARNSEVVDHFNRLGHYRVRLMGRGETRESIVDRVRAIPIAEPERVAREIADADLIATSIGCGNLPAIVPLISLGLSRRREPVNVIGFENFSLAASFSDRLISSCGCDGCLFPGHGFSPAMISRVMSERLGDPAGNEPLVFIGDMVSEFIVDGQRLIHPIPAIEGMRVVDNYEAWAQKKLFLFSAGHVATAYLGYLKGYHYIHSAVRDPEIREAVLDVMKEGQEALRNLYGSEIAGGEADLEEIMGRFENAALNDTIARVGRDPLRKLGKKDRLVWPAKLAEKAGIHPEKLMLAVAAALFYCDQVDMSCNNVRSEIKLSGSSKMFGEISGLAPETPLAQAALEIFSRLIERECSKTECAESPLLKLEQFLWA